MNITMIEQAAQRLKGQVRKTPLLRSPFLDELAGRRLWVKPECLQHTGSFKFRGGWAAVSALDPHTRAKGVIAFSSGNHAQGVAFAAQQHGCPAVIVMPSNAPVLKIDNTRALGAEVVLYDRDTQDRAAIGASLAQERDLSLIKPYDDAQVIAGQGTVGIEIAQQAQDMGITTADVVVPCGGGGLTSGIALALATKAPDLRVRPAEPEGFDDVARSLRSGTIQSNHTMSGGICDAIVTPRPGDLTFAIMKRLCGSALVVSEAQVLAAMAQAFLRLKIVAEPGGAVALAAALSQPMHFEGDDVIVVISGGNVDPALFQTALSLTKA